MTRCQWRISLFLCVLFLCGNRLMALSEEAKLDTLAEARQCFEQANRVGAGSPEKATVLYKKAFLRYQRLVEEGGIRNGRLFYNMGNIAFRMGDIGRAILFYRRAQLYIPNDPNLKQNLRYARKQRADRVQLSEKRQMLEVLLFWHYDISQRTRAVLFLCGYMGLFFLLILRLWRPGMVPRWLPFVLFVFCGMLFISVSRNAAEQRSSTAGVVVAEKILARKGNGLGYQPSFEQPLHAGTEFVIKEVRSEWAYIELLDGRRCWLPQGSFERVVDSGLQPFRGQSTKGREEKDTQGETPRQKRERPQ